jgi:hypothetical protein
MLKKILIALTLCLLVVVALGVATPLRGVSAQAASQTARSAVATSPPTGTLQKMIVENGSVTVNLDLNRLNPESFWGAAAGNSQQVHFAVAANSFFPILIFNDLFRGIEPGSMALIPVEAAVPAAGASVSQATRLPLQLSASLNRLVVEKLPSGQGFDLAVRDSNTGFIFFNLQELQYDYDAAAQSLAITNGRLLLSKEFAKALGHPSDAGSVAGTIAIGAAMQPIQITQVANGHPTSAIMPPMPSGVGKSTPTLVPGPDVIVGDLEDVNQLDPQAVGTQVGLAIGTDSCYNGDQPIDWFALPSVDHPIVPQNLYRMSGGADNQERFEQIGQSWVKHTFEALEDFVCGTCNTSGCETGTHLCPGCSDPYVSFLNGDQDQIGSRAWINPFTGAFPANANDHSGHSHNAVSHRILVETSDLIPGQNPGATYFGEAAYIAPFEYTWCQSHPGQCNMFNNFSYRPFSVSGGPTVFNFSPVSSTVRMQPAIQAWAGTGATVNQVEPDPGNDGIFFVGYKVTGPNAGVWHYEYAVFNMNLDRAIQSFEVEFGSNSIPPLFNIEFHAPPQHPGWPHDGTVGDAGYSNSPWTTDMGDGSHFTWSSETIAQNPNANAIRWGTLYNFRFDSTGFPDPNTATIRFFKTGSPVSINNIPTPYVYDPTPTPTPTPTPPITPTPTATPSATVTPTPTPRATPRPRPTPHTRP